MNEIRVISPYKSMGTWVFDDPSVELVREPFVAGIPELIERLVQNIPDADSGFRLLFTDGELPGADLVIERIREEGGGHWYRASDWGIEGWLCPAMFRYFETPPEKIAIRAEAAGGGIARNDSVGRAEIHDSIPITLEHIGLFEAALDRGDIPAVRAMLDDLRERLSEGTEL